MLEQSGLFGVVRRGHEECQRSNLLRQKAGSAGQEFSNGAVQSYLIILILCSRVHDNQKIGCQTGHVRMKGEFTMPP